MTKRHAMFVAPALLAFATLLPAQQSTPSTAASGHRAGDQPDARRLSHDHHRARRA